MNKLNRNSAYFLAQISHDLRQPLQALLIYLDLFDSNNLSAKQKRIWKQIVKTTNNLNCLLTNILDFSKLEFSELNIHKKKINLTKLFENIIHEYETLSNIKRIKFEYNLCNVDINTDAILFERVLRNLLNNAFKFTKDEVKLICKEHNNYVMIKIIDNGIGIDNSELPYIFDDFFQGKNIHDVKDSGAGLGLAIVKKITVALGITIDVKSALGNGSIFTLNIKQ